MMYHTIKLSLFTALLSCATASLGQDAREAVSEKLWDAVGGKDNWRNARYFMFSCVGGSHHSFAQGERKYLWDKQTGNCRFDGISTDDEAITALFNIGTAEGTVYLNGVKLDNPRTAADVVDAVLAEFEKDAYFLFLPTALDGDQVHYTVLGEKLVGSQRFTVINVKNNKTRFAATVAGQLYMDTQTGRVQRWQPSEAANQFTISGFKDVGGGLVLPTRFIGTDASTSVTYPIAAALVNIEEHKFNRP